MGSCGAAIYMNLHMCACFPIAFGSVAAAEPTRQARGERRRDAILEAALRVIAQQGVSAVTHRAVASEAGVPLSSTTYYFESLDELLEGALLRFVRAETERLEAAAERLEGAEREPLEAARLFRAELEETSVAQFELYLEVSRRPRLREVARRCLDLYAAAADAALRSAGAKQPEVYARGFVALFDGYGLHRIAGGDDQGFEDALMALWAAATRATGTR
jgi:TetR/AcrR family transcriptional regulator, regulator of biofilm formation and stress response